MNILKKIGLYKITDWIILKNNSSIEFKTKKLSSQKLIPIENSILSFITKNKLRSGWYLFGILHYGNNNRAFGRIFPNKYTFKQSRPMYPCKRRWRIIRLRKRSNLILEILNIEESFDLKEIWLLRIPFFEAMRRIKKRLSNTLDKVSLNQIDNAKLWMKYNKLLKSQYRKSTVVNYSEWIRTVEFNQNKILKNYKLKENINFKIKKEGDYSLTNEEKGWILFMKNDHILEKNAIKIAEKLLLKEPNLEIIYFDEDQINRFEKRFNPDFKTSWNRELFFSNSSYITSCFIKGSKWNNAIKELAEKSYSVNIYSILIKITSDLERKNNISTIAHVPYIGFHLKKKSLNKQINNRNSEFLKSFLKNNKKYCGDIIDVKQDKNTDFNNLYWSYPKDSLVSIIIPTKDKLNLLKKCLSSIERYKPGISIEIIIVNNGSKENSTLRYFDKFRQEKNKNILTKIIDIPGDFNFSRLNNIAAKSTNGNVILMLNNDVHFIKEGWGNKLAQNALRSDIGCVGAKLFFDDMSIQHAGVIMGIGGIAGHSLKYFSADSNGYQNRLILTQEFSAVTAACLAISKSKFFMLNGFNEQKLKVNYNDVDLCLRAKAKGFKNIYLPEVQAIHLESKTRGKPYKKSLKQWHKESNFMKKNWYDFIKSDPFYNMHLSLDNEQYSINLQNNSSVKYRLGNQSTYNKLF